MKKVFYYIWALLFLIACQDVNHIVDCGKWVKIKAADDSIVNGYALIDGKIYCGFFDLDFIANYLSSKNEGYIKDADVNTFEICVGTHYARDKRTVYYPRDITYVDGWDWGGGFATDYFVPHASRENFKYLRNGYAISGNHMYYEGEEIVWREDILNDEIPITDSVINQNVLKEKNLLEKLKDINYEISIGL